jgi:hypothetical protein
MAKVFTAAFAQTPKIAAVVATTAYDSVAGDTPTNTIELLTAGADGAIVTSIWAMPRGTVTATALQLWVSTDSGTTKRLIDSELMAAHTVATTTAIPETKFSNYSETAPLRLPASAKLYVGIGVSLTAGIVFKAEYTDY